MRPAGQKNDPEPAGTCLQQSGTTVRACVIYQRTGGQTAQSINLFVRAFPIWRASRQQLNSHAPERYVRLGRCTFELYGFGDHPIRCAYDVLDLVLHRTQVN